MLTFWYRSYVTVDTTEIPYRGLTAIPSPPPSKPRIEPSVPSADNKALLHNILLGQHPAGVPGAAAASALAGHHQHALLTAHRTNVYTTNSTGEYI